MPYRAASLRSYVDLRSVTHDLDSEIGRIPADSVECVDRSIVCCRGGGLAQMPLQLIA